MIPNACDNAPGNDTMIPKENIFRKIFCVMKFVVTQIIPNDKSPNPLGTTRGNCWTINIVNLVTYPWHF